ncbi:sugar phosphate nucleotidyltransferase [Xylanibacter muris]|uniref:NTP transferase domain-containing protein n=1 Tax=Xylanibacter muris TaxID=2736290 RepID=A0ABX2ALY1_9BACT|nr:sugar phosphate nucleotidyltransferase [Xylanibacter muris]NPD91785.1 NTP transferase domain-containing protein [Xylanibacter muris]
MKFAIIAAGEGSRLAAEGIEMPKPLVEVGGESLIDRLIRIFMSNNPEEIVVICNDRTAMVSRHLVDLQQNGLKGRPVPLRFLVKSTPSSMHSFHEISRYLGNGPFVLTTVDTIFLEDEFTRYVEAFEEGLSIGVYDRSIDGMSPIDGMMVVTDYIDDESPLYVETDAGDTITGFLDKSDSCRYISGGIYGLTPTAIKTLDRCISRGESRMRNFQRALVADGQCLKAYSFSKVLDIDHVGDIAKAEEFLAGQNKKTITTTR